MITGNKGEWSEIYVFLKLLGDGCLYAADENLNKLEVLSFPITAIKKDNKLFQRNREERKINIIDGRTKQVIISLYQSEFIEKSNILLERIKQGEGSFNVSEIEQFMNRINVLSLKSPSTSKGDITIILYDVFTSQDREFNFSIKSQIGSSSTLLNAGKTTNFIYKIEGNTNHLCVEDINGISTSSKIKDRIEKIRLTNGLKYVGMESDVFDVNLQLIDSRLPEIISNMVLYYYSGFSSSVEQLTLLLNKMNPLEFNLGKNKYLYEYKIKKFLREIALGMVPSKEWSGELNATGGYIIVKENGDVVCYHIYNMNQFEEYLFMNTKFDTASTTRHQFGMIYEENNELYLKLNLQIRFNK